MEIIETKTLTLGGDTYRISVYPDSDAASPLDDWCEMGTILSLNRRHRNFDPDGVEASLNNNPDAVPLSYYEHGLCLWCVAGELPAGADCPWDSVRFAGVWLPDAETLALAGAAQGPERRRFMAERARQACEAYTQWCNGEVYGYEIERLTGCDTCGGASPVLVGSCSGASTGSTPA